MLMASRLKRWIEQPGTGRPRSVLDRGSGGKDAPGPLSPAAPRYASHAARLNTGLPVCQTKTAIFNGAQDHLLDYCSRLGGEMVGNS